MRCWLLPAAVAIVVLALSAALPPGVAGHGPTAAALPLAPARTDAQTVGNTSINDIVNVNQSSPVGTFAPGSVLQVSYRVSITTVPVTASATVYVPGMVAAFPALPAPVQLFLPPHNLTTGSGGSVTVPPTPLSLRTSTSFNGSHGANLNSELVAVMSTVPFGSASVVVQWNWTLRTVDGAYSTSGWGPANSTPIHPAEVAFLQSLEPRTVLPPATITACLGGPIQSRTFSLHAETAKPVDDFVQNTTRDPAGGPSTLCLSVLIPATITPQTILMHIWDYESVTLLLYIVKVGVVNASSGASPTFAGAQWTALADAGLVAGALALAGAVAIAVRREPSGPTGPEAARGSPSSPPAASPPSPAPAPSSGDGGAARSRR